jgi:hypothetical protein
MINADSKKSSPPGAILFSTAFENDEVITGL